MEQDNINIYVSPKHSRAQSRSIQSNYGPFDNELLYKGKSNALIMEKAFSMEILKIKEIQILNVFLKHENKDLLNFE
jgi:hypothetical protein